MGALGNTERVFGEQHVATEFVGATQTELEALPEIGPKVASDIAPGRAYESVEDVDRVQGIGPKTMEAIRSLLTE